MKTITSPGNARLALLRELQRRPAAYREHGLWLAEGLHLLREWLAAGPARPAARALFVSEALVRPADATSPRGSPAVPTDTQATVEPIAEAMRLCPEVVALPQRLMDAVASGANDRHVLLLLEYQPALPSLGAQGAAGVLGALGDGLSVWLEEVQDGGNVGTIIRTAASAGAKAVVLGPGCAAAFSPKVVRSARGGHFGLSVIECPSPDDWLTGLSSVGSRLCAAAIDPNAEDLFELDLRLPQAWLFGNEGHGLSAGSMAHCARWVRIPHQGPQSLNVASAAAVCLFENLRQMRCPRV